MSAAPLMILLPTSGDSPPSKKKKSSGREVEKRELYAAKRESLRTYEDERQVWEAEEEELHLAIYALTAVGDQLEEGPSPAVINISGEDSERGSERLDARESGAVGSTSSSELSSTKSPSSGGSRGRALALVPTAGESVPLLLVAIDPTTPLMATLLEIVDSVRAQGLGPMASRREGIDSADGLPAVTPETMTPSIKAASPILKPQAEGAPLEASVSTEAPPETAEAVKAATTGYFCGNR